MACHLLLVFMVKILLQCPSILTAGFAEAPSNITLMLKSNPEMGSEAVFRCRHPSINAFINWRVNGSPVGQFFDITVNSKRENGIIVNTLSIPVRSEYNGTEVVCLANFLNGSFDISSAVVLTIIIKADFCEVPYPSIVIVTIEERYEYRCNHSQTSRIIDWRVNGSVLLQGIRNVSQNVDTSVISFPNGDKVYTLTIGGILEHNETTIQCIATFNNGSNPVMTQTVLFLIQGTLNSIQELIRSNKTLLWTAPFSLDLTDVDPDIVYRVEVYNITCGRSLLISECDVMETSYTNDALLPGYIYEYTVTPRSNVEGASNGTSLTVAETFGTLDRSKIGYTVSLLNNTRLLALKTSAPHNNPLPNVMVRIYLDADQYGCGDSETPASYIVILKALDGLDENEQILTPRVITNEQSTGVILALASLPFRRLWNVTIFAYNCKEHQITDSFEIGTHNISNISVSSPHPGVIVVTGDITDGSSSDEILIIVYSLTDDSNSYYIPYQLNLFGSNFTIEKLPADRYGVSVFVIETSGLPYNRAAATPKRIHVQEAPTHQHLPIAIMYEFHPTSTGVCITCTFLDSSTTACVAVVHQRISHLSSSGLIYLESSHKFNRSGDTAYGCVEDVNLEQYQVGIERGIHVKEHTQSCTYTYPWSSSKYVIAVVVGVLSIIVGFFVIFTVACAITKVWHKIQSQKFTEGHQRQERTRFNDNIIQFQKCGAYDIIHLSKQRITMDENRAYGHIGVL